MDMTLWSDITALPPNDALFDVKLEGSDGILVPAFRNVLAARSQVLRSLLCGDFEEASKDTIPLREFSSTVLQAVVEFCFTDEIDSTFKGLERDTNLAFTMVHLVSASDYFNLPALQRKAVKAASALMNEQPSLALTVLEETSKARGTADSLTDEAINIIRNDPKAFLLPDDQSKGLDLKLLSEEALGKVLADENMVADEITLFHSLIKWIEAEDQESTTVDVQEEGGEKEEGGGRKEAAKRLVEHIRVSNISTDDLCNIVVHSGIVPHNRLVKILADRLQVLNKGRRDDKFVRYRFNPYWVSSDEILSTSKKYKVDLLLCEEMSSGVYTWKIGIKEPDQRNMMIGVVCMAKPLLAGKSLSEQSRAWCIDETGSAYHANKCIKSGIFRNSNGDVETTITDVAFKLDLSSNGILSIEVNDSESVLVFEDILAGLDGESPAFVPAVSHDIPGCIELKEFCGLQLS